MYATSGGDLTLTTAKMSTYDCTESPEFSNKFSWDSPKFQTSFHGSTREFRSLKREDRKIFHSGNPNILSLISSVRGIDDCL